MLKFFKNIFSKPKSETLENQAHEPAALETALKVEPLESFSDLEPIQIKQIEIEQQVRVTEQTEQSQIIQPEPESLPKLTLKVEAESQVHPDSEILSESQPDLKIELELKNQTELEKNTQPQLETIIEHKPSRNLESTKPIKQEPEVNLQALLSANRLCLIPASPFIDNTIRLFKLLLHPLVELERTRLIGLLFDQLDKNIEPHDALISLLKEGGQSWGQWILINAHTSLIDEFEWQAQELAYNWKLTDDFEWESEGEVTRDNAAAIIQDALQSYREWLGGHNFSLVILQSNKSSETIGAFILPHTELAEFNLLANQVNLKYQLESV